MTGEDGYFSVVHICGSNPDGYLGDYEVIGGDCPCNCSSIYTETASYLRVHGLSGADNYYTFLKGINSSTGGDVYYIKPNAGGGVSPNLRKILKIQVKGSTVTRNVDDGMCAMFVYNATTNQWTISSYASSSYVYSVVTKIPLCTIFN
jgi:hypothetical protein